MADTDVLEDDDLELSDEERARRAAAASTTRPIGTPMVAPEPSSYSSNEGITDTIQPQSIGKPLELSPSPAPRPNYEAYQIQLHNKAGVENVGGFGGKLLRGAEAVGSFIAPNRMAQIPGTRLHHEGQIEDARRAAAAESAEIASQGNEAHLGAETEEQKALAAKNSRPPVEPKKQYESIAQMHAAAVDDAISRGVDPAKDQRVQHIEDAIQRIQKQPTAPKDTATVEDEKYEDIKTRQATKKPVTTDEAAWANAYEKRKTLGPAVSAAAAAQRQENQFSRGDVITHDKEYVFPANQVERSYQLYKQAQRAFESGDAKTGAATMLMLSQHIGTTFGQVKGSRANKDLIEEHKNAIGVEDRIERFGEMIKSGQQLSPNQVKEFGDQISEMRKLTWQMAEKEAKRKGIPVDFMPQDLGGAPRGGNIEQHPSGVGIERDANGRIIGVH